MKETKTILSDNRGGRYDGPSDSTGVYRIVMENCFEVKQHCSLLSTHDHKGANFISEWQTKYTKEIHKTTM